MLTARFDEQHGWSGHVKVTRRDLAGRVIDVVEFDNVITNVGKNHARDCLAGTVDPQVKYVALGSSSVAPSTSDTQLGNEQMRKQVTDRTVGGTGVLTTTVYIAPNEGNFQIEEIGWFAGSGATGASNTGTLISRVLYSHLKNVLESIQVDRTDTFS